MFGYVKPCKPELLVADYECYRAAYCGVCRALKSQTGPVSHAFLTYDSVFLALVRMVFLPDEAFASRPVRCIAHPLRTRPALAENDALTYTARAFMCLAYHKLRDDLHDEPPARRVALSPLLPVMASARRGAKLPQLDAVMERELSAIRCLEEEKNPSADLAAAHFGDLLAAVFSFGLDGSAAVVTGEIGRHLGRFIYCADAAEDYEKDCRRGTYNPYVLAYGGAPLTKENRETIHTALLLEADGIGQAVELLPFGDRGTLARLIRNITYRGLPARVEFLIKEETP